jgi:cell shape-determining protein MreC
MNYLLDKNTVFKNRERPRRKGRAPFIVLIVVLVLFFGGNIIYKIVSPVLVTTLGVSLGPSGSGPTIFSFFNNQNDLLAENDQLKKEIVELKLRLKSDDLAKQELLDLQVITGRFKEQGKPVVAKVFRRPPYLPFDTFLVDVGSETSAELEMNDKVLVGNSVLLGEVVQIMDEVSKIKMYSSPGITLGVLIGPNKVPVNAVGVGGGNFTAELPRGTQINKGDKVIYQALDTYLLGVVGSVDNDPRKTLQTVYISSPVNIYELSWVEIVAE